MLFHEVYGNYYKVLARILKEAAEGGADRKRVRSLVREEAFLEGGPEIADALFDGSWPFLKEDGSTALRHAPEMPLTDLEKAWMNAVFQEPRVKLFLPEDAQELPFPGREPLFAPDFFVRYDRYADGDPYEDPVYREHFRKVLTGLQEKRWLRITYVGRGQKYRQQRYFPRKLEYSPKDDKFRLQAESTRGTPYTINLARIEQVSLEEAAETPPPEAEVRKKTVCLELVNERNTLERALIHFSDLQKETVRLDETHYRLTLYYAADDETEILIRILSFGPTLKVTAPEDFLKLLRDRLERQKEFATFFS